jgi:hypothetical protein
MNRNCGNCLNRGKQGAIFRPAFKAGDNPNAYCPIVGVFVPRKQEACGCHEINPKSVTVEKPEGVNDADRNNR